MQEDYESMRESLISIASEVFRFQHVFQKALSKLELDERTKYSSQYAWFSKKVVKALDNAHLKLLNVEGQLYDPGMAVSPLNIDDFDTDDQLYVLQMIDPIIMRDDTICRTGTVILGRIEK